MRRTGVRLFSRGPLESRESRHACDRSLVGHRPGRNIPTHLFSSPDGPKLGLIEKIHLYKHNRMQSDVVLHTSRSTSTTSSPASVTRRESSGPGVVGAGDWKLSRAINAATGQPGMARLSDVLGPEADARL